MKTSQVTIQRRVDSSSPHGFYLRGLASIDNPDHAAQHMLFAWHGGEYIEVQPQRYLRESVVFDVINVWDYTKETPSIPYDETAMMRAILDWIEQVDPDFLWQAGELDQPPGEYSKYR